MLVITSRDHFYTFRFRGRIKEAITQLFFKYHNDGQTIPVCEMEESVSFCPIHIMLVSKYGLITLRIINYLSHSCNDRQLKK